MKEYYATHSIISTRKVVYLLLKKLDNIFFYLVRYCCNTYAYALISLLMLTAWAEHGTYCSQFLDYSTKFKPLVTRV